MNDADLPVSPPEPEVARGSYWRPLGWGVAALLLLTPLVAMQFTSEVNWTTVDFVVFGTLLVVTGGAFELTVRMTSDRAYWAGAAIALLSAFLMLWINGAVGIIGNENNPANLMFLGVLAVGAGAALLARGRPSGMARAMLATAAAQLAVGLVAPVLGLGHSWPATALFVVLWLAAALLFHRGAP